MPFGAAGGQFAEPGAAATIVPGCGPAFILAGIGGPMSVSVFVSAEAGVMGRTRMIALSERSSSKIMNAREASRT
jgi:hypothetical protein